MDQKSLSLSQLVFQIKDQLNLTFDSAIWITAEISELNVNYSGHCYMELVEKNEQTEKLIAKSRATVWANTFRIIKPYFETTTRESLKAGLKVLIKVTVEFHEFYGFSLNVTDIDPSYTVGDLVLKRNVIVDRLTAEGVIDMNKALELPIVPQRIAVISSETAAGYGDFINQLNNNAQGFHFNIKLFPAVMQGNNASESIITAFNTLFNEFEDFDVVVLIRGGGSKIDLSCFDDYDLGYIITQLPLPVITGIGHERDESIADLVANTALKTPTAVAEFLIDIAEDYWFRIQDAQNKLVEFTQEYFGDENNRINDFSTNINYLVKHTLEGQFFKLENQNQLLNNGVKQLFKTHQNQLSNLSHSLLAIAKGNIIKEKTLCELRYNRMGRWLNNYLTNQQVKINNLTSKIDLVHPQNVLNRGYALVSKSGKTLKNTKSLKAGDKVKVTLAKGNFHGEVESVDN